MTLSAPRDFTIFQPGGAADAGDFRSKIFGKLDRHGTDPAGGAVDQHLLSALNVSLFEQAGCHDRSIRQGGGLVIGQVGRFERHCPGFGQAEILGIGAHLHPEVGKHLVAGFEFPDVLADRFDFPGQFTAQDVDFGLVPAKRSCARAKRGTPAC